MSSDKVPSEVQTKIVNIWNINYEIEDYENKGI
jgi:hypothetical protein